MSTTITCSVSMCKGWEYHKSHSLDWSGVYNYASDQNAWCTPCYCYDPRYGVATRIYRVIYLFDTSSIPEGAYIHQAVLKGVVSYVDQGTVQGNIEQVSTQLQILRATGYPVGGGAAPNSVYYFMRDQWITYGKLYVSPEFSNYAFEVLLNDYILGDIVGGGLTPIGMRMSQDVLTAPTLYTTSGAGFPTNGTYASLYLDVTYDTVPGIFAVTTLAATNVTKTEAKLWGEITSGQADKRGFDWGEGDAMDNEWYESGIYGLGQFSHDITGLTEDTEYCFRAKGEESA